MRVPRTILNSKQLLCIIHIGLIVLLMVLLSSCSRGRKDGPPNFYVDETKVHNPVPKPEPLAKLGNMRSYVVKGKRYYTMKSSKHYRAVGTASWYGTMFHAQRTSSGEPYNMLAMTAAHKTLPLPTYVEVTNLANHRKIIVKVNDRGPFKSNRIIDLSYVAAKKLHMLGRGTARVSVEAIDPYSFGHRISLAKNSRMRSRHTYKSIYEPPKPSASQHVYLQVGAFHNKNTAEKLQRRLVAKLEAPVSVSKGKLYRVRIGPIRDFATVNKISQRLKQLGIKANKAYGV